MSTFIENQNWRYATKKFDATKKIATEDLNLLKEAIRLSTSSFGLQLYKVIIIENPELKAKLLPAAYGQTQIVDASHVVVFANQTSASDADVDSYIKNISETREIPVDSLSGFGDYMKGFLNPIPAEQKAIWNLRFPC